MRRRARAVRSKGFEAMERLAALHTAVDRVILVESRDHRGKPQMMEVRVEVVRKEGGQTMQT